MIDKQKEKRKRKKISDCLMYHKQFLFLSSSVCLIMLAVSQIKRNQAWNAAIALLTLHKYTLNHL